MYSKDIRKLLFLAILGLMFGSKNSLAADTNVVAVDTAALPINVSDKQAKPASEVAVNSATANALVSPSQAQKVVNPSAKKPDVANDVKATGLNNVAKPAPVATETETKKDTSNAQVSANVAKPAENKVAQPSAVTPPSIQPTAKATTANDFDFNLKVQSVGATKDVNSKGKDANAASDLPKNIQYTVDPVENLGNDVLSQMDSDLFTQMSEIEKSTTLLTLELRREKLRNEIEAQKAIRKKSADDLLKQQEEEKLRNLEKKKQIEARILQERQLVLDKEKVLELLKQRKLLNAYMNQMLMQQQQWLKEKENLYAQLAAVEEEKKELIVLFRQRIDKVLDASSKNIQTAEAAKANFDRIVKGLKARNEQLRKRIEADAKIIKNAKSNLYIQSQSIEELKDRKAQQTSAQDSTDIASKVSLSIDDEDKADEAILKTLSSEYAILGITGRSGVMSVDLINSSGQPLSLKMGSPLPTGHIVSEIGADYVKFTRDGQDDYLYVGKTIDGIVPTFDVITTSTKGN